MSVPVLSERDVADVRWASGAGVDAVALPFVRRGEDVRAVHRVVDEAGARRLPVFARLERPQAVAALQGIVEAFDGVPVARVIWVSRCRWRRCRWCRSVRWGSAGGTRSRWSSPPRCWIR